MKTEFEIDEIANEQDTFSDDALFNITSFGIDMSFKEIISMYDDGDLEKPEMQRNYVWTRKEASRFIDSILLGLPVPSIFLAKAKDEKRLIVDGYQRIMTVYDYVNGIFSGDGKPFSLLNSEIINSRWRGKVFKELSPEEQRKIRYSPIHAIVFEQKHPADDTGMYQIFERINTSGRVLKPQEIRNCVYRGSFNQLLIKLNLYGTWRNILEMPRTDTRMLDIELILRAFAFYEFYKQPEHDQKQINLLKYLNQYMGRKANLNDQQMAQYEELFKSVIEALSMLIGSQVFHNGKMKNGKMVFSNKINPAILDSVFTATAINLGKTNLFSLARGAYFEKYIELLNDETYQAAISTRTTTVANIQKRISLASSILYEDSYAWKI